MARKKSGAPRPMPVVEYRDPLLFTPSPSTLPDPLRQMEAEKAQARRYGTKLMLREGRELVNVRAQPRMVVREAGEESERELAERTRRIRTVEQRGAGTAARAKGFKTVEAEYTRAQEAVKERAAQAGREPELWELEQAGERALPGMMIPGKPGELFIPPPMKYSQVRPEHTPVARVDETVAELADRGRYDDIVKLLVANGATYRDARERAGREMGYRNLTPEARAQAAKPIVGTKAQRDELERIRRELSRAAKEARGRRIQQRMEPAYNVEQIARSMRLTQPTAILKITPGDLPHLLGHRHRVAHKIERTLGVQTDIDPSEGTLVIVGPSQDAVEEAIRGFKEALTEAGRPETLTTPVRSSDRMARIRAYRSAGKPIESRLRVIVATPGVREGKAAETQSMADFLEGRSGVTIRRSAPVATPGVPVTSMRSMGTKRYYEPQAVQAQRNKKGELRRDKSGKIKYKRIDGLGMAPPASPLLLAGALAVVGFGVYTLYKTFQADKPSA